MTNTGESEVIAPGGAGSEGPSLVVGVGASAGGLEALVRMFDLIPEKTGCAFVVVQHLSPDFKSVMDELLARHTKMPIRVAEEGMALERDTVYLNPPKKRVMLSGGALKLTDKDPSEVVSHPIDHFFRSLAREYGERAVAVVLSGTGSDGSKGLREVHAAGGMVIAQTPESAGFDGMPRSAIDTKLVHRTLSPEEIPDALLDRLHRGSGAMREEATEDVGMGKILRLLHDAHGIDFSSYKPSTILRRTERRAEMACMATLEQFSARLESSAEELDLLYKDLLIGVTRFFRDTAAFEHLSREVVVKLVRGASRGDEIRVWVAGCATGEEAYSIGILLREAMESEGKMVGAKIFATDVHQDSIRVASQGVYDQAALVGLSPERKRRFFTARDGRWQVTPELRAMIVFAPHNILKDAPFTNLDLVSCRNLLIYFEPPAQRKVLGVFHFGLKAQGALFLGPSETPGELSDEFDAIDQHWKLFRKRRDVRLAPDVRFAMSSRVDRARATAFALAAPAAATDPTLIGVYDSLLDEFMPPSLLVGPRRELTHSFGGASRFLKIRDGRLSNDVADMLDGDLRVAVVGALQRVFVDRTSVTYRGLRTEVGDAQITIDLIARPIRNRRTSDPLAVVLLQESTVALAPPATAEANLDQASREHTLALESELKYTRENLQATIEELETSNEELQATNEELVAANEELQSTNEELHSVNEELHSVNAEFQHKLSELIDLNADLDNLLSSTEVHTLFLDQRLCVRKFTPRIAEIFNLLPQDVGRSIEAFSHSLQHPGLVAALRRVTAGGEPFEDHTQDTAGRWFLVRVLPYRRGATQEGAVLTLVDVSRLRQAELEARQAVAQRDRFLATLSHELRNPLAAILNAVNVLARRPLDDEARRWQGVVADGARHMDRLLDDLLDVARVAQDKMVIRREPMDLRGILPAALEVVAASLEAKRIGLSSSVAPSPLHVDGDQARLQQVLTNLLVNAVRYTPEGGRVRVSFAEEDGHAVLRVSDTGIGLGPGAIERIFEPFFQVQAPGVKSRGGGMGVGLSLARHIVSLHDGTLAASSAGEGQGSTFTVRLPLVAAPAAQADDGPQAPPAGLRVLLVEDDEHNRRGLQMLLTLDELHVTPVGSGEEAIEAFASARPDVVLLDIGLPGINGHEACRRLRALPGGQLPVYIALSGFGQESDRAASKEAGFHDHATKPIDLNELYTLMREALRRPPA